VNQPLATVALLHRTWATFGAWQRSKGITPWEMVHARRASRGGILRFQLTVVDAFTPAMRRAAGQIEQLALAIGRRAS
jgi:hypothetical protein